MLLREVADLESLNYPTYVRGVDHIFRVMAPFKEVQAALRPYAGAFMLGASRQDFEQHPKVFRREFKSTQDLLNWLQKHFKTDSERGFG